MSKVYTFDSNIISDLYKDAYGFRPSADFYREWNSCSDDQRQSIWDNLLISLDAELEREREQERKAIERFENSVADCIRLGAKDRTVAINCIFNANGFYDYEEMEFRLNLPFNYLKQSA